MTRTFGIRDDFAIEAGAEPDCEHSEAVWGRICVWCSGIPLGDIGESYCAVGGVYAPLRELMSQLDQLWAPEFQGRNDLEIMNFLDERLYGMHGDVEVPDNRTLKQVAADAATWGRFDFLTGWGSQFDSCKAFIVRPAGNTLRILSRDLPVHSGLSVSVSQAGFLSACEGFVQWFEEQSRRRGVPCETRTTSFPYE